MKRIASLLLFSIFLASCANVVTPTLVVIETSARTATAVFTPPSTETPTATPEPTNTPDPLAGAPEGAMGKDKDGNYIQTKTTENGNTTTYMWDTERKSWYRQIFTGYAWDLSPEFNNSKDYPMPDQLLLNMYIDQSVRDEILIPTLSHKENKDTGNTSNNFSALFLTNMARALINRNVIKAMHDFDFLKWNNRELHLDFTNLDGPQRWGLWPGTTIDVHIRGDYDALKADMVTNGFSETQKKTLYGPANNYMLKIWADANNNLHVDIAPSIPATEWTEDMFYEMAFIGPGNVFESPDQTHPQSGIITGQFIGNRDKRPYFTFGPPQ